MTILCATNFSPCARSALLLARSLAERLGESLFLLHVVEPAVSASHLGDMQVAAWERARIEAAEAQLTALAAESRERQVQVQTRIVLGSPSAVILETARELRPRLLVLGARGRKPLLGGVAAELFGAAPAPVLVTPALPIDTARWSRAGALRIAVGVDGSPATEGALPWLFSPAGRMFPGERILIRLFWAAEEAVRYGIAQPWCDGEINPELQTLVERDLRHQLNAAMGANDADPLEIRVRGANAEGTELLAAEVGAAQADLLVIGMAEGRPKGRHPLLPADLLPSAGCPILVVPPRPIPARQTIPPVRSLLVASDLSDLAIRALPRAYALLREHGGRVELLHVHETGLEGVPGDSRRLPLTEQQQRDREAQLRATIPLDAETRGIATQVTVLEARSAAEAILQTAERLDVDVLALASHGRGGLRRAVMGSVAEQVARHSARPVLIIHEPASN